MLAVPTRGQAVHAPSVMPPYAAPCVTATQVMPRPIAAATANANNDPMSNRTLDPVEWKQFLLIAATRPLRPSIGCGREGIRRLRDRSRSVSSYGRLFVGNQCARCLVHEPFNTHQDVG